MLKIIHYEYNKDYAINFDVVDQIQCFWYQIKAWILVIPMNVLTLKKIEFLEFYIQIKRMYKNMKQILYIDTFISHYLLLLRLQVGKRKKKKKENGFGFKFFAY